MGKLLDLFNQQLKQDKRSQVITKLNGLVNFIIRNLDMSKRVSSCDLLPYHPQNHACGNLGFFLFPNLLKL